MADNLQKPKICNHEIVVHIWRITKFALILHSIRFLYAALLSKHYEIQRFWIKLG